MLHSIIDFIVSTIWHLWYTGIFIMMFIESSLFIPFPSEVAMVPAWYLISQWKMSLFWALTMWTWWALLWASVNYMIWYYLWEKVIKKIIKKYGKIALLKEEHYNKTEKFFIKHWIITTFIGRLIPIIRQYISLPAWVFKINYIKFLFYTTLWAWLWNLILIWIWYLAWENEELIKEYSKEVTIWLVFFIIIVVLIYIYRNKKK